MATHHTTTHVDTTPEVKAPKVSEPKVSEPKVAEPDTTPSRIPDEETPRPPDENPSRPREETPAAGGPPGGGYSLDADTIDTMADRLGKTKEKVDTVAQNVGQANFGDGSLGALGVGMAGTLNKTVSSAQAQVTQAAAAVDQAGARTKAVKKSYQNTDIEAADTLNAAGRPVDADTAGANATTPSSAGGESPAPSSAPAGPPPPSPPPNDGGGPPPPPPPGGGMHNNQGHFANDSELTPQYTRPSMQTRPTSTDDQIRATASRLGYDPDQHLAMTLQPTADLTPAQRAEIVAVRNELHANPGEIMTKVVKPEMGEATLDNKTRYVELSTGDTKKFDPAQVGGSVARGSDTAQYGTPGEFRTKLALDDNGAGWTPIEAGAPHAYQLRFPASGNPAAMEISYGGTDAGSAHEMQVLSGQSAPRPWDPPFLGTGYTGGGVPEWLHARGTYDGRAEMYLVHADGTESLAGVYLDGRGWFDVRGRGGSGG